MLYGQENYIVLNSEQAVQWMIDGVTSSVELSGFSQPEEFRKDLSRAIYCIRAEYERKNSKESRDRWKNTLDDRRREVGKICTMILDVSESSGIANPIVAVYRSRIIFYNGVDLEHQGIHPGSCWEAYKLFMYVSVCKTAVQLQAILRAISTIFQIVKDLKLDPAEQDQDVLEQLSEITGQKKVDKADRDWGPLLDETLELINQELDGRQKTNYPFIKRFAAALKRVQMEGADYQLTPENLKLSNASSGACYKGESLPGYLGSLFERDLDPSFDYTQFDMITGYTSNLSGKRADRAVKTRRNYCVAIEQHKSSMRLVHVLANQFHDRLTYFEHYHKRFLLKYPADDSFRQLEGRNQMISWIRNKKVRAVYSLDLHAATNTLSLDWQAKVNNSFLRWIGLSEDKVEILSAVWYRIMSFDSSIVLPTSGEKIRFKFGSGQPMGFTDSFFSFSLLHHIVILCVCKQLWDQGCRLVDYRVVGDDSVVAFESDPQELYPMLYVDCMAYLGTECNERKGYIYNKDTTDHTVRIAEFCKFLICAGVDVTPIPLGALAQAGTASGRLTLLSWLSTHNRDGVNLTPKKVCRFCGCSPDETKAIYLLARIPVKNILHSESSPLNLRTSMRIEESRLLAAASIAFLKQALILELLVEVNRNINYVPKYSDYHSFSRKYRKLIMERLNNPQEYDLEYNKFYRMYVDLELKSIAQNIACEDILNGLIPSSDILDLIPILNYWDEASLNDLLEIVRLWDNLTIDGEERETPNGISDYEVSALLNTAERVSHYDVSTNNHRYYTRANKVTRGLDLTKFLKDTLENLALLGSNEEELDHLIIQMDEEFQYLEDDTDELYATEVIDSDGLIDSDDSDTSEDEIDVWQTL